MKPDQLMSPSLSNLTAISLIESHPDFKILRRVGCIPHDAPPPEGAKIAVGVILDTETTGPDTAADKLIELGMVKFEFNPDTGQIYRVLETFNALEDPGMPISAEATAVNGITNEMVKGQHIHTETVNQFVNGASLIIAHHAEFDRKITEARFSVFAELNWACSLVQIDWDAEGFGTAKLDYLATKFGMFYDAHRAENDCLALLEVLRQNLPISGVPAMKSLSEKSSERSYKVSAENAAFATKDLLKAHGFRWDDKGKVWHITVAGGDAIKEVVDFLREDIYNNRNVTLPFEIFDAKTLFSVRGGVQTRKSIIKEDAQMPIQTC